MIANLRGTVLQRTADRIVVEVGGVGLEVLTTPRVLQSAGVGTAVNISTTLVVREDSLTLYGFSDAAEKELFALVQTVTGIGPRVALTILGTLTAEQFRRAILDEDLGLLCTVPGIGRKSAERLVVDLRDRVPAVETIAAGTGSDTSWRPQVRAALVGLGWSTGEAEAAISKVGADGAALTVPEALRQALQSLDRTEER